jgi:uncharacterized protein
MILVSDFGAAEFSSALARRVRMHHLTREDALLAFEHFDTWTTRAADRREITTADNRGGVSNFAADQVLRRLDVNLRTPDALHIAIAQRLEATLVTFDWGMAAAARPLGMAVATP